MYIAKLLQSDYNMITVITRKQHQSQGIMNIRKHLKFGDGDGPNLCRVKKS